MVVVAVYVSSITPSHKRPFSRSTAVTDSCLPSNTCVQSSWHGNTSRHLDSARQVRLWDCSADRARSRLALLLANVPELEQPSHGASSAANKGFRVPHSRGGSPVPQNRDPWHRGRRKPPEVPQLELRQRLAADPLGAWPLSCLPLARAEEGSPSRYCCSVPGRHKPGSNNSSCWRCRQRYN